MFLSFQSCRPWLARCCARTVQGFSRCVNLILPCTLAVVRLIPCEEPVNSVPTPRCELGGYCFRHQVFPSTSASKAFASDTSFRNARSQWSALPEEYGVNKPLATAALPVHPRAQTFVRPGVCQVKRRHNVAKLRQGRTDHGYALHHISMLMAS